MSTKETVNFRIDKDVYSFLKKEARALGIPTKALITLIVTMRTRGEEKFEKFMEAML